MMRPLKKYAIAITIIFSNESWNQVISNHFLSGFLLDYKTKAGHEPLPSALYIPNISRT